MNIDNVQDCIAFSWAWTGHPTHAARMTDQASDMESCLGIIRDDAKAMRWAGCIRALRRLANRPHMSLPEACAP